ncbi:MAG: 2-amino-4-hydroxy-6-hydroxymethyldihydropteridine diphosphokinase [Prochlorotrichaceae cyanobacterium]|jgi:2-amino-4-hydroxy-6-hydroxymethyldihydropteridine diphosphokinase
MEPVTVAIALGSNLGESYQIMTEAIVFLGHTPGIHVVAQSPLYQTAPVGPPQPDYLNACALLQVTHAPHPLLQILLDIERKFGRVRRERWGPRLLDLDLILYGQEIIDTPDLQVPHPRMRERSFVLVPLADIAPDWFDPVTGKRIEDLAAIVDRGGVHRYRPID